MDSEARDIIGDFTREAIRGRVVAGDAAGDERGTDVQELAQAWVQERSVKSTLPSRDELVQRIVAKVQRSQRVLEEHSADNSSGGHPLESDKTRAVIVEAELERVQFLLRAYTRTRLRKAEERFTGEEGEEGDGGDGDLLTPDERAYARARVQLVKGVLGGEEDGEEEEDGGGGDDGEEHVVARDSSGRVQAVRWRKVQAAVLRGDAELV